jgi:uncharacterized protein YndB with AHSA1/START domain
MSEKITVQTTINAPVEKVWEMYNGPEHIVNWNSGSDDWHTPNAENDLSVGGKFKIRMEAKDGSSGFDFSGTYDEVVPNNKISYTMDGDGRKVTVLFEPAGDQTTVTTTFDPENENTPEVQRQGWQNIADKLKSYVESK